MLAATALVLVMAGCVGGQTDDRRDATRITAASVADFTSTGGQCTQMFTNDIDSELDDERGGTVVTYRRNVSLSDANHSLGTPTVEARNDSTYVFDVPVEATAKPSGNCSADAYARYDTTVHLPTTGDTWHLVIQHDGAQVGTITSTPNGSDASARVGGTDAAAGTSSGGASAGAGYGGTTRVADGENGSMAEWGMSPPGELVNVSVHRARGDAISVEGGEMGGDAEYVPETDSVRFPTVVSSSGPEGYETESLDEFAEWQCGEAALDALRPDYTQPGASSSGLGTWNNSRRDTDDTALVTNRVPERHRDTMLPMIRYRVVRENGSRASPNVSFDGYLDRMPRTVEVSVTVDGQAADCTVPIYVKRSVRVVTDDDS